MITAEELRERKTDLSAKIAFARTTDARATEATLLKELEIIELALIGIRPRELNND